MPAPTMQIEETLPSVDTKSSSNHSTATVATPPLIEEKKMSPVRSHVEVETNVGRDASVAVTRRSTKSQFEQQLSSALLSGLTRSRTSSQASVPDEKQTNRSRTASNISTPDEGRHFTPRPSLPVELVEQLSSQQHQPSESSQLPQKSENILRNRAAEGRKSSKPHPTAALFESARSEPSATRKTTETAVISQTTSRSSSLTLPAAFANMTIVENGSATAMPDVVPLPHTELSKTASAEIEKPVTLEKKRSVSAQYIENLAGSGREDVPAGAGRQPKDSFLSELSRVTAERLSLSISDAVSTGSGSSGVGGSLEQSPSRGSLQESPSRSSVNSISTPLSPPDSARLSLSDNARSSLASSHASRDLASELVTTVPRRSANMDSSQLRKLEDTKRRGNTIFKRKTTTT